MCFNSQASPPPPTSTPSKILPQVNYPEGSQSSGKSAGASQRKRAAAAQGYKSTIVTGSQGLANRLGKTTNTTGGLLS